MVLPRWCMPLLAIASVLACSKKPDATDPTAPNTAATDSTKPGSTLALNVVGEPVRKGDLVLTVNATGQIRTDAVSTVKAEAVGTVKDVFVRAGDAVKRGQILVSLDPKPLDLDIRSAQASLAAATVNFQTAINTDSLFARDGVVRSERRTFLRASSGLDGLEIALEKAKLNREHADIISPFDGVVQSVSVAVGDRVSGNEVATIVDMKHLRVEAQVLEHDLPLLQKGGDAFITVAAFPDRPVRGTIAAVLPLVDSVTRAGRVVIRVNGDGTLRPGMYVDVRLEANRLHNRIIVPASAVIERDARPLVFVAIDGKAEWVYVQAGRTNGRETEILPDSATGVIPLKPGDMVLTANHLTLSHQAPIKLSPKKTGDQP